MERVVIRGRAGRAGRRTGERAGAEAGLGHASTSRDARREDLRRDSRSMRRRLRGGSPVSASRAIARRLLARSRSTWASRKRWRRARLRSVGPTVEAPYWVSRASSLAPERVARLEEEDILSCMRETGLTGGLSVFKARSVACSPRWTPSGWACSRESSARGLPLSWAGSSVRPCPCVDAGSGPCG